MDVSHIYKYKEHMDKAMSSLKHTQLNLTLAVRKLKSINNKFKMIRPKLIMIKGYKV